MAGEARHALELCDRETFVVHNKNRRPRFGTKPAEADALISTVRLFAKITSRANRCGQSIVFCSERNTFSAFNFDRTQSVGIVNPRDERDPLNAVAARIIHTGRVLGCHWPLQA